MKVLDAIRAANADGDYPTSRDLADGLGESQRAMTLCLATLHHRGHVCQVDSVARTGKVGGPRKRWKATC